MIPSPSPEPASAATAAGLSRILGRPYVFLDPAGHLGVAANGVAMPAHRFVALMLREILAAAHVEILDASLDETPEIRAVDALFKQLRQPPSVDVPTKITAMLSQFVADYAAAEAIGSADAP